MIKNLPEKLRTLRQNYGYSQKQVALRLGISPSIVSGYETGERTPSAENLLSLSYLYKCSTDYLLGKEPNVAHIEIETAGLSENQINAILHLVDSIKNP